MLKNDLIDTLGKIQCNELAWARHLLGEITEEAAEAEYKVENTHIEMWKLVYMLKQHLLKMNMIGRFLLTTDTALDKALELVREGQS